MESIDIYELFNKACIDGSYNVINELLKSNNDYMQHKDTRGNYPIFNLLNNNDIFYGEFGNKIDFELFKKLINLINNIDQINSDGETILEMILSSCLPRNEMYIKFLMEKGALLENCKNIKEILTHLVICNNYGSGIFKEDMPTSFWYNLIIQMLSLANEKFILDNNYLHQLIGFAKRNKDEKMENIIKFYI